MRNCCLLFRYLAEKMRNCCLLFASPPSPPSPPPPPPLPEIGNNIDLLTEILLRLPIKSVDRFKCVSKQWLSLISDPQFCLSYNRHHHSLHLTPTALALRKLIYPEVVPLKQDNIPAIQPPSSFIRFFDNLSKHGLNIKQSCNGLFLCTSIKKHSHYICNPITKQFKSLSYPSPQFQESLVSVCMAFDPLKSNHYNLICICTVKDKKSYQIDMYSSETDSWSPLGISFTSQTRMDSAKPVFCNGVVHWFIEQNVKTSRYFDVDKRCLNTMPMPNLAQRLVRYFGESQGHLHLIVTEWPTPFQFDVLEMAPDYSEWLVKYNVNLDATRNAFPDITWYGDNRSKFSVLGVILAQMEEESIIVVTAGTAAISCNLQDGTSMRLCTLKQDRSYGSSYYRWTDTFQYFEFLTSDLLLYHLASN